jgi:succinate dehydrogenase / fumarate reductase cytochrome b subunit
MSQASAGAAEDKARKAAPRPRSRPLSPHLQIWRWHVTMLGSILHRFTGLGLCAGAVVVTAWLAALAAGKETYALFMSCAGQPLALVVWVGLSFCAFYHLASGLRHLIWDTGLGLKPKSADALANLSVWFAVLATVAFWSWSFLTGRILP